MNQERDSFHGGYFAGAGLRFFIGLLMSSLSFDFPPTSRFARMSSSVKRASRIWPSVDRLRPIPVTDHVPFGPKSGRTVAWHLETRLLLIVAPKIKKWRQRGSPHAYGGAVPDKHD